MHEAFVSRQNIQRLSRLLAETDDPEQVRLLRRLISEERQQLAAHGHPRAPAAASDDGKAGR